MKNIQIFPLIRSSEWQFRCSVYDKTNLMVFAFGPESCFMIRFFTSDEEATCWIEECMIGKHFE